MQLINADSKILVLGRGLIGSAFLRLFDKLGYTNVIAVNRQVVNLTGAYETVAYFKKVQPDYVINAAGKVGGIIANRDQPADFITSNLSIQMNVIRAAHEVGVKKAIFFASSCMYPKETAQPMKEEVLFTGKPEPTSMAYAISKMAGMQLCLAFNQQYGSQKYIPVIPNSVYGPNDNFDPNSGHVLSSLIRRFHEGVVNNVDHITLWGTGSSCREFIHADDVAKACMHLLANDITGMEFPVNIGVGEDISIKDLAEKIAALTGFTGEIRWDLTKPDGAKRKLLDSTKMFNTGWQPEVSFEQGIVDTFNWYKQNVVSDNKAETMIVG
jgi:GDP-L-fucose synthase